MIILGLTEILSSVKDKDNKNGWLYLSIGITGVIQSHVLSTEMVCVCIAILLIIMSKRILCKDTLMALCKSVLMAIGLNAGFIIPFIDYSGENINVYADKTRYGIQRWGISLYELLSLPTKGKGIAGDAVDGIVSRIPEALGISFIIIILASIVCWVICDDWEKEEKRKLLIGMILACIVCFMSTVYFPWNLLAAVPGVQKMVYSIQFPWRFLTIAVAVLTYVACILFMQLKKCLGYRIYSIVLAGLCVICAIQGMYITDLVLRNCSSSVVYDGEIFLSREKAVSGGEYLLSDSSVALAFEDNAISGNGIEISDVEWNGTAVALSCSTTEEAYLAVPLFAYDYYRCIDMETKDVYSYVRGDNNKITVGLPADYRGRLKISFMEPWYWRVSEAVSLVSLILWVLLYCKRKK